MPLEPDWCCFPGPMPLGRSPLGGRSPLDWMDLIRWLLGDWCPLEPFAAAGPIAVAGPIAAGPEPDVGAVVIGDGLDGVGVPDEPCLSPRVAISTNSNELCVVGDADAVVVGDGLCWRRRGR